MPWFPGSDGLRRRSPKAREAGRRFGGVRHGRAASDSRTKSERDLRLPRAPSPGAPRSRRNRVSRAGPARLPAMARTRSKTTRSSVWLPFHSWSGQRALDSGGQATKGAWGMSRRQEALKGAEDCDKPGVTVKQVMIPGFPNRLHLNP